jgi:formate hydrogenlyase transcriptional activator
MSNGRALIGQDYSSDSRYRLLLEITDYFGQSTNLVDVFGEFAPPLLDLTASDLLCLSLLEAHRDYMSTQYWTRTRDSGIFEAFPVEKAASGWAWRNQKPVAIADIETEGRFPDIVPALRKHGVRSYTVLPLSTPNRHFGAMGIGRAVPETLGGEDMQLLSRVASLGALALEKERIATAYEEQQSLLTISQQLSSNLQVDKLLPVILTSLRSIARYENSILSLLEKGDSHVYLYGEVLEWEPFINHGAKVPTDLSLSATAIQSRKVTFYNLKELNELRQPIARKMVQSGIRSTCSIPIIAGGQVWGALNLNSPEEDKFGLIQINYLQQVANQIAAALQNAHAYKEIDDLKERLSQEKRYLEYEIRSSHPSGDIVGASPSLKRVRDHAATVADTDSTVIITGETGTGKERIARLIHDLSRRRDRNFIKLNCAAIPTGLLESELFGHEKGAFTGAVSQKLGRLELADKGTLLLDEVGEIPLEVQPKLLRVLQDQEFERLGGTKTIHVDVRLIAATNRDLVTAVQEKQFRSDLFYRLHVFPLHLPALRERREDIPELVQHFIEKCSGRLHKHIEIIPPETMSVLVKWKWPGNIRELENYIERSVILSEGTTLNAPLAELRDDMLEEMTEIDGSFHDRERQHIIEILRQTRGALSGSNGAASRLGLKRTTLQYKMKRLGITRTDYSK